MGIHVVNDYRHAGGAYTCSGRGRKAHACKLGVQPHHAISGLEFPVDDSTVVCLRELTGSQPKDADKVVVGSLKVPVDEERNTALNGGIEHGHLLQNHE